MVKVNAKEPIEVKRFDLNIEKILENWEVCHGIREEIVNAIDEQALTNSKEIEMFKLYRKFLFCCGSWAGGTLQLYFPIHIIAGNTSHDKMDVKAHPYLG